MHKITFGLFGVSMFRFNQQTAQLITYSLYPRSQSRGRGRLGSDRRAGAGRPLHRTASTPRAAGIIELVTTCNLLS